MQAETRYSHCSNIAVVGNPDEARVVIMRLNGTHPHVLTDSAAIIWGLVDGLRTVDAIIGEIIADFPGAPTSISETTRQFLEKLQELQLLDVVEYAQMDQLAPLPSPRIP